MEKLGLRSENFAKIMGTLIQILREINFCESVVLESAILTVSTPLKSSFSEFSILSDQKISKKSYFRGFQIGKITVFEALDLAKFDFT